MMTDIKYSFLIPFYNRPTFHNTLLSWEHHYGSRKDWECILVVDSKTNEECRDMLNVDLERFDKMPIRCFDFNNDDGHTGVRLFNFAATKALGQYFILSCPEVLHETNVLSFLGSSLR